MEDTSKELVSEDTSKEPVSRETRRSYVFFVTLFCLVSLVIMVGLGAASPVALIIAEGFVRIVELLAIMYVGASVIDRSEVLSKIADAIGPRGGKK